MRLAKGGAPVAVVWADILTLAMIMTHDNKRLRLNGFKSILRVVYCKEKSLSVRPELTMTELTLRSNVR